MGITQFCYVSAIVIVFLFVGKTILRLRGRLPAANILLQCFLLIKNGDGTVSNVWFWWSSTGYMLSKLLERSACAQPLQQQYILFFVKHIFPILGPTPAEFRQRNLQPMSYLSDDHTAVEVIWVVEGPKTAPSIRFAMEPLERCNGYPLPPTNWITMLRNFSDLSYAKSFDLSWPDLCYDTLVQKDGNAGMPTPQFFLGGDFTPEGMVGKVYYIPKLRAQSGSRSCEEIVTDCICRLGLEDPWNAVLSFISSIPERSRPTFEMLAVDCVSPAKNRLKVYFRTHERTFNAIANFLTLDGYLDKDHSTQDTLAVVRSLWEVLFPGVGMNDPLPFVEKNSRDWPGFLVYYEFTPNSTVPFPKVYIPVRQYCVTDAAIASRLVQYLRTFHSPTAAQEYSEAIYSLISHRKLESRTGVHTYVACCARKSGPQLSIYLSPEVFAPERYAPDSMYVGWRLCETMRQWVDISKIWLSGKLSDIQL